MKCGIITFHFVHNQGAILQCYALQKVIRKMGHEPVVIDYCPGYHVVKYARWKNPYQYVRLSLNKNKANSMKTKLKVGLKALLGSLYYNFVNPHGEDEKRFRYFIEKHLPLTSKYKTLDQLRRQPPKADVYISGSDQVWNPELLGGSFDAAYFLDFGCSDTKRVTYSVSIGQELDENKMQKMKRLCENIDTISLREREEEIIDAINREIHICIDPTLLLDSSEYEELESASESFFQSPYIFVYGFQTNADIKDAVNLAREKFKCKVINGSPARVKLEGNVEQIYNYTPDQFLLLIKNAECVVTNSFHGTAFSIIYRKRFITVAHTTRGRRMTELLSKLELQQCLWNHEQYDIEKDISYDAVHQKLAVLREQSIRYLRYALERKKGEELTNFDDPFTDRY